MIKGMIFAAGMGTRLRPLTDTTPKALIEVGGRPMLRHVIEAMASAGVGEIVVNVHHLAQNIIEYIDCERDNLPARIVISDESDSLLETGGGLLRAAPLLADAEAVILHNADILSSAYLGLMLEYFRFIGEADALLMVDPARESSRRLLLDDGGRIRGRINLSTGTVTPAGLDADGLLRAAFSGIHVIGPRIFGPLAEYSAMTGRSAFSIMDFYLSDDSRLRLQGYVAEKPGMWFDIGRPESLVAARAALARNQR